MMMVMVKRCPHCRSPKINFDAGVLTGSYYCGQCGYDGPIILEEEVKEK